MRKDLNPTKALAALALVALVAIPVVAVAVAETPTAAGTPRVDPRPGLVGQPHAGGGMMGGASGMMSGASGMMGGMAAVEGEFDFLARMIPHHEEAIESARVLLAGTERPEMKAFAEQVIETQSAEVVQMEDWLATWYPGRDTAVDYQRMMRDLTGLTGDALDRAFLDSMVPHHMMAVMMSQQLVTQGLAEHPEVVPFAETIRDAQHAEIQQMAAWLQAWFGASPMDAMMGSMGSMGPGRSRQDVVAERGAEVMPFDLDATTHVFDPTDFGGIQTVVADAQADTEQVALVRAHLRAEASSFARGDFSDPTAIHGADMPGLAILEASSAAMDVAYRDVPGGGEIAYRTTDPAVVQALHDWFAAQLMDHGDHAQQP
jgi:uncharacterized protein (DUF305 family)